MLLIPLTRLNVMPWLILERAGSPLPKVWKDRLGKFLTAKIIEMKTADQRVVSGEVCGPVQIQIEGFDSIFNEVVFLDMEPTNGRYEPLIGYIILEQSRIAVDVIGHRLIQVKYMDLKRLKGRFLFY
jgi:hypothetical protein